MMWPRSLRARFLLGSTLWTAGLLAVSHILSIALMGHMPALRHSDARIVSILALVCMASGLVIVRSGLSPINHLRKRLAGVRAGRDRRVGGQYPAEVQPLVDDLNALLAHREQVVARALAKAGDLAHGLKTPLAVLAQEAEQAEDAGLGELATAIGQQITRMRRQVDYHLAHARAAASGATPGARASVSASADALARTLLRLHTERGLTIAIAVDPRHAVRVEREDLDEMLGNLLDNACTWARSRVAVSSAQPSDGQIVITVEDDGSGLDPSMRSVVLQRGVRADEAAPGSGLGLAIVRDLVELYGGSIALEGSPDGGLRARLQLPGC